MTQLYGETLAFFMLKKSDTALIQASMEYCANIIGVMLYLLRKFSGFQDFQEKSSHFRILLMPCYLIRNYWYLIYQMFLLAILLYWFVILICIFNCMLFLFWIIMLFSLLTWKSVFHLALNRSSFKCIFSSFVDIKCIWKYKIRGKVLS